jgi:uncharacterized lipoprotein NlpE involved in copper resistance
MNKKGFVVLSLAALIFGLGSCVSNRGLDNAHNSRNSLDWAGVYTGTIPSGSGPGIDVRLRLNADQSFELRYVYLDRSGGPFDWAGSFQWDEEGNVITLDIADAPPHYQVAENTLIELDMKGKPVEGKLAENYALKKER